MNLKTIALVGALGIAGCTADAEPAKPSTPAENGTAAGATMAKFELNKVP